MITSVNSLRNLLAILLMIDQLTYVTRFRDLPCLKHMKKWDVCLRVCERIHYDEIDEVSTFSVFNWFLLNDQL